MSDSVKQKILIHCPLFFGGFSFYIGGYQQRRDPLTTVEHADIRVLVTA